MNFRVMLKNHSEILILFALEVLLTSKQVGINLKFKKYPHTFIFQFSGDVTNFYEYIDKEGF